MSCRTTPAGSVATTTMSRLHGLEDGQCTSLFHELRRTWTSSPADYQQVVGISPETYFTWMRVLRSQVEQSERYSPALRARALLRIDNALRSPAPSDDVRFAAVHSLSTARLAEEHLNNFFETYAETMEVNADALHDEFKRIYRSYEQERHFPEHVTYLRSLDGAPADPATRYAQGVILMCTSRCSECGQFTPRATTEHSCPEVGNRPLRPNPSTRMPDPVFVMVREHLEEVSNRLQNESAPTIAATPTTTNDNWVGEVAGISMETFQEMYDQAREEISAGNTAIPTFASPMPGEVTGGLGARGTGNSFGIELELDFPDDTYPYSSREIFAQRLHSEGIVTTPFVQRWHYVGDDRPGGEYIDDPNGWICEYDRSVDDEEGERGVEIKSQILYDEPQTWHNLSRICAVAEELGAKATFRTGLHVNIGGSGFPSEDPATHNALLRLAGAYDDTIVRLAHNPDSGRSHRGRGYCQYAHVPSNGFSDVATARAYSNHYQAFNLGHLPAAGQRHRDSSRIEVRVWDSTVDAGRIQHAVASSLAIVHLALNGQKPGQGMEPAGSHREQFGTGKLTGEQWESSTTAFRRFITLMQSAGLSTSKHQYAFVKMFAESRWQSN